ncbi:MAG: 4Fe-4S binding protein [Eubacteriaceae bacterium]|nr:4Fe-4S binding protein [Eubacteriaceae bacterium]
MSYLGENFPKLGFGLMRLPFKDVAIDIEHTSKMVDMFLERGFNYFDTAYGYNNGESEKAIKKALVDRYDRDKFMLTTKLPAWAGAKNKEEAQQMFYTSLERTGAGYFDFYLLHNLGENRSHAFDDYDIWSFLQKKKEEGLIKHLGFSFHDKAAELDKILNAHPEMEFVQLQINYADWESTSVESRLCYETARKHNKPVIIMEPVKGGTLASPPPAVAQILQKANPSASASSWAIRFAASLEGVICVLSGMSSIEQMDDNTSYMKNFKPLSKDEYEVIKKAQEELDKITVVPCTSCEYCMKGCPQSVAIPGTFQAINILNVFDNMPFAKSKYTWNTKGHKLSRASECIACGQCESVCPQHIKIIDELKKAAALLE